jgi:MOSC domain-containing protein YiiM
MATLQSLNIGARKAIAAKSGWSGIDKLPTDGPVAVRGPGPKVTGAGGIVGDAICDVESHGGDDQALSSVPPVILLMSQVQAFLPDVRGWSRPFPSSSCTTRARS